MGIATVRTLTVNQLCERKNDLIIPVETIKELVERERAKAIDELVNEAMRSFTEYDLTERIATVAGCKMLLMKVAEQLKEGGGR